MRAKGFVITGSLVASLGCAGGQPAVAESPAVPGGPCTAVVRNADVSGWRTEEGSGFTFCMPPGWRSQSRSWLSNSARFDWNIGSAPVSSDRPVPYISGAMGGPPAPSPDRRQFNETIGGRTATLRQFRDGTDYNVAAAWADRQLYFSGVAQTPVDADLLLAIYRTVRFSR